MLDELPPTQTMYRALVDRDSSFDGVFVVGVKTTGIFCRPTCPAKKPHRENVEFFPAPKSAIYAGYRACKRCKPLLAAGTPSDTVARLLDALEERPDYRWTAADLRELGIDPSTARRQFKARFGMTFAEFARAQRLGRSLKTIRDGGQVIEAQLDAGFESGSGYREAVNRTLGLPPVQGKKSVTLASSWIETRLGPMLAIADEEALLLLEFIDRRGLERYLERMKARLNATILPGETEPLRMIEEDLAAYFRGDKLTFDTPFRLQGSPFQEKVWQALGRIPAGETRSYSQIAAEVGVPSGMRAVARANGSNVLCMIVPCHRVIREDGSLAGYGGHKWRKRWLIGHEARFAEQQEVAMLNVTQGSA